MKKVLATLLALMLLCSSAMAVTVAEPGTLPLTDEDVTLVIGITQNVLVTNYEENWLTQYLEGKTGVKLDFNLFPSDQAKQKFSLMVAGGEQLPDIVILGLNDTEKLNYGQDGYFVALNDWLENDAYFWQLAMDTWTTPEEKADVLRYAYSADGNIYGYPGYYIDPGDATALGLWINKAWLDNLGLEVPTTTDELYEVLKAFKEQDANGNGDPDDEIPLIGHTGWRGDVCLYIINSFIYDCFDADFGWQLDVKDGKLYAPFTTDEFRQALEYLHKLSDEGILSPLSFSQGQAELKAILSAPDDQDSLVGAFSGHPSPLFDNTAMPQRVYEYVGVPAMVGPEGVAWSPYSGWFGNYNQFVTADGVDPYLAFRFLDACAEQEASISIRYGEPGVDWQYTNEGIIRHHYLEGYGPIYELLTTLSGRSVWTDENDVIWHTNFANMLPPKLFAGLSGAPYEGWMAQKMDVLWYSTVPLRYYAHPDELSLKLIFTAEELDEISDVEASIRSYVEENITAFILGNRDIEAEWDAYISELEAIGLERYLEVAQDSYDRLNG